MITKEEIEF